MTWTWGPSMWCLGFRRGDSLLGTGTCSRCETQWLWEFDACW